MQRCLSMFINEGKERGIFKEQEGYVIVMGMFGMINWIHQWYDEDGKLTKKEIINTYINNLEDGYKN